MHIVSLFVNVCFSQDDQKTKDSEIPQAMQTPPILNSDDDDATTAESVKSKSPHTALVKPYFDLDGPWDSLVDY